MKSLRPFTLTSLLFCAFSIHAQSMKPGLWEITQKMKSSSAEMNNAMATMQAQMAKMSPEQRKQMQEMMAKQGVNMDLGGGAAKPGEVIVKMCMTQEMIDQNQTAPQQPGCTHTQSPRVGNTWKMSFTCTKPPSSGEGQTTMISPDAYTMKMAINSSATGKPERMEMEGAGKWLGASCGDVKPLMLPKGK
jgi:Protein of unknown function (DUF3617)